MKKYSLGTIVILFALAILSFGGATPPASDTAQHIILAGDGGGPIPTCRPGTNCPPDDQLRQLAGDGGGPIPTCRPGTNCPPDDQLRMPATVASRARLLTYAG